jgi:hypothetical protein
MMCGDDKLTWPKDLKLHVHVSLVEVHGPIIAGDPYLCPFQCRELARKGGQLIVRRYLERCWTLRQK